MISDERILAADDDSVPFAYTDRQTQLRRVRPRRGQESSMRVAKPIAGQVARAPVPPLWSHSDPAVVFLLRINRPQASGLSILLVYIQRIWRM